MQEEALFEGVVRPEAAGAKPMPQGAVRLERANRDQVRLRPQSLDELLPDDHRARAFWTLVESYDMTAFERGIRSRTDNAGRAATDPRVLLCLWLFSISEGNGSARHLAELCERDAPYMWIAGGLTPNYHTLSNFRIAHGEALDQLLTDLLAGLMRANVVSLRRTAQDGVRVRANAGAASFRREPSLRKAEEEARRRVAVTKAALDAPAREESKRKLAARHRAAQDREAQVKKAREAIECLRKTARKDKDPEEVRASATDPEARVMRMADGGYRPAVNVQVGVDTQSRIIVDVAVTNSGSDMGQMTNALDRIERRAGRLPEEHLADGGYAKRQEIEDAAKRKVKVYAPPIKSSKRGGAAPPSSNDGPGVTAWRERMQTPEAQDIYKERAAAAETVFADWRQWRDMKQMPVRGLAKTTCVALLASLTYNFIRMIELGIGAIG